MTIRLEFPDKYRLWSELVRARTVRLFVPTPLRPRLGDLTPIELLVDGVMVVAHAQVVGLRGETRKFRTGIWVRFEDDEIEKVRRFLGLTQTERPKPGRRTRRFSCTLPLKIIRPQLPNAAFARDLSETGLMLDTLAALNANQLVEIELTLDDGTRVELKAEVTRDNHDGQTMGLRFVEVPPAVTGRLIEQLDRLSQQPTTAKPSVLIADDEPAILDFLSRALSRFGYEVHKARDGEQALAMVRELKPKLVVLDILMPGIDGVDICKSMRADIELADIPVVFVSALAIERLHEVADEAGATDYLTKPVGLNDLLNVVGEYLSSAP